MTREHKLSLIIGFTLVLLVAVLISDHLSGARQAVVGGPQDSEVRELVGGSESTALPTGWSPSFQLRADQLEPALEFTRGSSAAPPEIVPNTPGAQQPPGPVPPSREAVSLLPDLDRGPFAGSSDGRLISVDDFLTPGEPVHIVLGPRSNASGDPQASRDATHIVAKNETLFGIAAKYYGSGHLWRQLAQHNSDRVGKEGQVRAGVALRIPPRAALTGTPREPEPRPAEVRPTEPERRSPSPAPKRTEPTTPSRVYVVKANDTLSEIAMRELGTIRRMKEIIELNGSLIRDANDIRVGMALRMPNG